MLVLHYILSIYIFGLYFFAGLNGESLGNSKEAPCPMKYQVLGQMYHSTHTACQKRNPDVTASGVNSTNAKYIVDQHNRYRSMVVPPAADMLKVDWDNEVAMIAQAWANTCSYDHDENYNRKIPGRFAVGQNIGKGFKNWENVMKGWFDEHDNFTYGADNNIFHVTGHYTQMVWATSRKIGCGYAQCGETNYHVCNYAPGLIHGIRSQPLVAAIVFYSPDLYDVSTTNDNPVSFFKQPKGNSPYNKFMFPYRAAVHGSCGDCPDHCSDNLCDCGDSYCENGGYLNLTTCQCTCQEDFYEQEHCKLVDCTNITDNSLCGNAPWNTNGCKTLDNTGFHCPNLCKICQGFKVPDNNYIGGASRNELPHMYLITAISFLVFTYTLNQTLN